MRLVSSKLYFRKEHVVNRENVPANGTPIVMVSNHQNCLNDPLCVCLNLTDRRMNFLARANVFQRPLFNKALRAMGLLPAYRLEYDGYAAVAHNNKTMDAASEALIGGETVMLFPEGGHQDKRWLGKFKMGYLRIAFEAAERMNFERDVIIMPSCNHYSNYFHARADMLMKFGEPISLKPYYDNYCLAPRETMMLINDKVHEQIKSLMLHVDDLEHYDEIDFIRESGYGDDYARRQGVQPRHLPSRLVSDQRLVAELQQAYASDKSGMEAIYADTREYSAELKRLKIRDWLFAKRSGVGSMLFRALMLIVLLPLFVASIVPTALLFIVPKIFLKKLIKDQMFVSSFNVAVSALITFPVCLIVPFILIWIFANVWWALGYVVAYPLMFIFAWNYIRLFHKFMGSWRFVAPKNRTTVERLKALRKSIHERLNAKLR
ncbi:MAG: 1-acyl-sn-glycerol-3-phosphate acyltransferase [Alistipes sp.]|nr:1-acyl-sn-glycerol-3-phosphate acyltransferase [Alistipes sp.]